MPYLPAPVKCFILRKCFPSAWNAQLYGALPRFGVARRAERNYTAGNMSDFGAIKQKMEDAGLSRSAIEAFRHSVETVLSGASGVLAESEITPAQGVEDWNDLIASTPEAPRELIAKSVVIKLNGGLGTSMGLQKAKSLLPIQQGMTFLDLIVRQVKTLRERAGYPVRLLLMNSFSTSADTMAWLQRYDQDGLADPADVEMVQNRVPKLLKDTLEPARCPGNPDLEWCPPGHGDIYAALVGSGWLDRLLAEGIRYAFVSNSDNLGAQLDLHFLNWFAQSNAPFAMEVTRRTEADKKGGHLATRLSDGHLVLREVAQCAEEDLPEFQNIKKHRFFNTNNLWVRLDALKELMERHGGVMPLPVIRNVKTLDPRDASTPKVYQLEVAMGAAIECFPGATAVCVPRTRFFPVKTTSDLLLLRSDAVEIDAEGNVSLAAECAGRPPVVSLDARYKFVDALDALGVPSLKHATSLTVKGEHTFRPGEELRGDVVVGE